MDLHKAWQDLNQPEKSENKLTKKEMTEALYKDSQMPLPGLRKRLIAKLGYLIFFTALYAGIILYVDQVFVKILFSMVVAVHAAFIVAFLAELKQLDNAGAPDASLLQTLQKYYYHVRKILKYEEWYGIVVFPIIIPASLILGQVFTDPAAEVVFTTKRLLYMIFLVAVLGPLAHFAARKMNNYAYGSYLKQLRNNIKALKS
ncbi:hypothetical protein [uncultured Pontibacter sp.]|uniref:hypothetical protein n=1 Tax=uncultured Pontibacter sp. TaxID=453356 RepID=UPI0026163765|nr:hypothetical protein [uncultured Pontibacter sp.]